MKKSEKCFLDMFERKIIFSCNFSEKERHKLLHLALDLCEKKIAENISLKFFNRPLTINEIGLMEQKLSDFDTFYDNDSMFEYIDVEELEDLQEKFYLPNFKRQKFY